MPGDLGETLLVWDQLRAGHDTDWTLVGRMRVHQ